jgi:hypothetical protein
LIDNRSVLAATVVAAALISTLPSSAAPADPPRIVEWHAVGGVGIGLPQSRIVARYGQGKHGVRYNRYALHGGHLTVQYDRSGHVNGITVEDTPYYKGPGGFAVGYRIPIGACHKVGGACHYLWNGFTRIGGGGDWTRSLVWGGARIDVFITTVNGRVQMFAIAKLGAAGTALTPTAAVRAAIVAATRSAWCHGGPCTAGFSGVRLSKTDPTFAADRVQQAGAEGAVALLHRTGGTWKLLDVGTDQIGCGRAPRPVLNDLGLYCDG